MIGHPKHGMTNLDRGKELLLVPQDKLPPGLLDFVNHCGGWFMSIEDYLTAFSIYAEAVEGYPPCDDVAYRADETDRRWLVVHGFTLAPTVQVPTPCRALELAGYLEDDPVSEHE